MAKIVPNLWFETEAKEAVDYYLSVFTDGKIHNVSHYGDTGPGEPGTVLTVDFEIHGQHFTALNGGPHHKFNDAVSFLVNCDTQEEVDELWDKLTADGGAEVQCGWVKDRYGLSWQIIPTVLGKYLQDEDRESREPGHESDARDDQDRDRRTRGGVQPSLSTRTRKGPGHVTRALSLLPIRY